jgi:hypothetical protein
MSFASLPCRKQVFDLPAENVSSFLHLLQIEQDLGNSEKTHRHGDQAKAIHQLIH